MGGTTNINYQGHIIQTSVFTALHSLTQDLRPISHHHHLLHNQTIGPIIHTSTNSSSTSYGFPVTKVVL
ncbi:hypothetical protein HanOQP8_Chr02g0076771 [Helianthus annuus]|nr:hypothetical protein HanLR1_Chr02g0065871 [Helianthus annuus]KAJ0786921.1 hypothetical protein HanOQP8_Chr02g0076771 [Helianthus annuus]